MGKHSHLTETQYLYGIKVEDFKDLKYENALTYRLKCGRDLYLELYFLDNKDYDDEVRLFKVAKAVRHNEKLLSEIYDRSSAVSLTARVGYLCDIVMYMVGKLEASIRTAKKLFTRQEGIK